MESQQRWGNGQGASVDQPYRIEVFVAGSIQIVRKVPVGPLGARDQDKPVVFESTVTLRNPQNPSMGMNLQFSIPAQTLYEAFANWKSARENAERHVASELRSKIVMAPHG